MKIGAFEEITYLDLTVRIALVERPVRAVFNGEVLPQCVIDVEVVHHNRLEVPSGVLKGLDDVQLRVVQVGQVVVVVDCARDEFSELRDVVEVYFGSDLRRAKRHWVCLEEELVDDHF